MIGTILGILTPERTAPGCGDHRWVQVRAQGQLLSAVDLVGCSGGETVLLLRGETARIIAMDCPGDWAVAAVVSPQGNNG